MSRFTVVRCICFGRTFREIKQYAMENNLKTVAELQQRNYCSNRCKLCVPYVERMLQTGETAFDPSVPLPRRK